MKESAVEVVLNVIAGAALYGGGLWCLSLLAGAELPELWYMNIAF